MTAARLAGSPRHQHHEGRFPYDRSRRGGQLDEMGGADPAFEFLVLMRVGAARRLQATDRITG